MRKQTHLCSAAAAALPALLTWALTLALVLLIVPSLQKWYPKKCNGKQNSTKTIFFFKFPKDILGLLASCKVFVGRIIPVSFNLRKGMQ